MDLITLGIFAVTVIFGAGGAWMMINNLKKRVDTLDGRVGRHDEHFARHDAYFAKLDVQFDFIKGQLTEQGIRMQRIEDKLDAKKDK